MCVCVCVSVCLCVCVCHSEKKVTNAQHASQEMLVSSMHNAKKYATIAKGLSRHCQLYRRKEISLPAHFAVSF